jgi:hypothetical protein
MNEEIIRCLKCRRQLKAPKSVERRYGPVCWLRITKGNTDVDYGLPRSVSDRALSEQSLRDIHQQVVDQGPKKNCVCGKPLYGCDVWSFDLEDGGIELPGFRSKQKIYLHCNNCKYDHSLHKLGV